MLALSIESDKSSSISLISFYYSFFLESFLHDKGFNGSRN